MDEHNKEIVQWRIRWRAWFLFAIFGTIVSPIITASKDDHKRALLSAFVGLLSFLGGWYIIYILAKISKNQQQVSVTGLIVYFLPPVVLASINLLANLCLEPESIAAYFIFSYIRVMSPPEPYKLPSSTNEWTWLSFTIIGLTAISWLIWRIFSLPIFNC